MATWTGWLVVFLAILGSAGLVVTLGFMALSRLKRANIGMDAVEFFTRLIRGRGFTELGPKELQNRLRTEGQGPLLVDLRRPRDFADGHIEGVIHRPFDEFLGEVVSEGRLDDYKEKDVVLICDTGHMSRVVGEILGLDQGFTKVYSLKGGMKGWWELNPSPAPPRHPLCCPKMLLPRCCPQGA